MKITNQPKLHMYESIRAAGPGKQNRLSLPSLTGPKYNAAQNNACKKYNVMNRC